MESTKAVKEKDKKEPMTPKQRTIFILKIVGNVIFYAVIIALFLFSIMNINSGGKGGIPNLFGKGYLSVQSNSMSTDINTLPDVYKNYNIKQFSKGDLVIVKMLDNSSRKELKNGDVVTFYDDNLKAFNTHRIVYSTYKVDYSTEISADTLKKYSLGSYCYETINGKMVYDDVNSKELSFESQINALKTGENLSFEVTLTLNSISLQGDLSVSDKGVYNAGNKSENSHSQSLINSQDIATFNIEDNNNQLKAVVTSVNYGGGGFINTIQEYWLFIFVLPIGAILIVEIILVVKNILDLRREKNKAIDLADHEAQMAELQSEKERMRQELLAELRAQGALPAEEPKQEAPAEEKVEEPEVAPVVEEKAPVEETKVEETPAEDKKTEEVEEVKEETIEETPVEEKEEEKEPVVNDEALEPDMDIEENEEEK